MKNKTTDIAFIRTCGFIELQHEFTNKIVTETSSMDGIMGWMQIFFLMVFIFLVFLKFTSLLFLLSQEGEGSGYVGNISGHKLRPIRGLRNTSMNCFYSLIWLRERCCICIMFCILKLFSKGTFLVICNITVQFLCFSAILDEVDILYNDEDFEIALQSLVNSAPVTTQYLFVTATLPVEIYNELVEVFPDCKVIMGPGMHRTSSRLEEVSSYMFIFSFA